MPFVTGCCNFLFRVSRKVGAATCGGILSQICVLLRSICLSSVMMRDNDVAMKGILIDNTWNQRTMHVFE